MDEAAIEAIVERNIHRAIIESGMNADELASRIGVRDLDSGLAPDELVRMMEILNVTPEALFRGVA